MLSNNKLFPLILILFFVSSFTGCTSFKELKGSKKESLDQDRLITRHVKHALYKNEVVPRTRHFHVKTKKGVVTLSGRADNIKQMEEALSIAKTSQGVIDVANEITIVNDDPSDKNLVPQE